MAALPSGSVAIVGAGQIGHAAWCAFRASGQDVRVLARSLPTWLKDHETDFSSYVAGRDPIPAAAAVFDTIAFDAEDVARYDPAQIGRLVVVSSSSVYRDAKGRTLDEAVANGFPDFEGPIDESQPTVAPSGDTYSTRKVRMEQALQTRFGARATILRPAAVYGPFSRHPREWWFVKRLLDGRGNIPLALDGRSRFQTSSAESIGQAAVAAIRLDCGGIFNIADIASPTVLEIGETIAKIMDRPARFVPLEGIPPDRVGSTPWSVPRPFVLDGSKARRELGLTETAYNVAAPDAVRWLADTAPRDWQAAFPQLAAYPWQLFDYAAEDAYLASR